VVHVAAETGVVREVREVREVRAIGAPVRQRALLAVDKEVTIVRIIARAAAGVPLSKAEAVVLAKSVLRSSRSLKQTSIPTTMRSRP
jgi:hypothetical protein